jgi:glutathione synthase/RimK-type ligase-like ATP-grasp enzyme
MHLVATSVKTYTAEVNERIFLEIIRAICVERGIRLIERSSGWLLELSKGSAIHRFIGTSIGLNDQAAVAIAGDKVATSLLLDEHGLKHVPHYLLKSAGSSKADAALLASHLAQGMAVIKPLTGSKGRDVYRVSEVDAAMSIVTKAAVGAWTLCPYVVIKQEVRLVVLDRAVILAYSKDNPVKRHGVPLYNLRAGATARPLEVNTVAPERLELAIVSVNALGLRCAAVDIAVASDGSESVLEVNAAFSLSLFAASSPEAYQQTRLCYDAILASVFNTSLAA